MFIEVCFHGYNWQLVSIGLINGSDSIITLTYADPGPWRRMATLVIIMSGRGKTGNGSE